MEQLKNFSVDFLLRSMTNTQEAEEYYNNAYKRLEEEVKRLNIGPDAVQKTKKAKQAVDTSTRKAAAEGGNKENVNRTNAMLDSEESPLDSTEAGRPQRTRKTRVATLRESILSGEKKIKIKKEPADKPAAKPKSPPAVVEQTVVIPETPAAEKRKSSHDDEDGDANLSSESHKKLDDSVELIAKKPDLVEVSDDDADIMPPPAMPAAKARKPRATKKATEAPAASGTIKIKQEPVDEDVPKRSTRSKVAKGKTAKAAAEVPPESAADVTYEQMVPKVRNSSLANASTVSTETSVTTLQQQPPPSVAPVQSEPEPEKTRSKARTKSKKPVIDKVTKQVIPEPVAEPEPSIENTDMPEDVADNVDSTTTTLKEAEEVAAPGKATKTNKKNTLKKQSTESVYEDAKNDSKMFSAQVSVEDIQKNPEVPIENVVEALTSEANQMEVDMELPNVNNETFIAAPPVPVLPVIPSIPSVAATSSPQLDSTFNVPPPQSKPERPTTPKRDSIMTEDLSMAVDERPIVKEEPMDSPPRKPATATTIAKNGIKAPSSKKQHEIFK